MLVCTDNTSAVLSINHQGGTRSLESLREAQRLWIWAHPWLASLRGMHLPDRANSEADYLSRQRLPPGEWRLHPQVVQMMWDWYGEAQVNLFASEYTTHRPLWFSLAETSAPLGIDALANTWPKGLLYAFPHNAHISQGEIVRPQGHPSGPQVVREDMVHCTPQTAGQRTVWHPSPSLLQL